VKDPHIEKFNALFSDVFTACDAAKAACEERTGNVNDDGATFADIGAMVLAHDLLMEVISILEPSKRKK